MGASLVYLEKPNTTKNSDNGENSLVRFGVSDMQGWRINMEDAHITNPNFDVGQSLFAVFDGHGGKEVALYCSRHLGDVLKTDNNFRQGEIGRGLQNSFLKIDQDLDQNDAR